MQLGGGGRESVAGQRPPTELMAEVGSPTWDLVNLQLSLLAAVLLHRLCILGYKWPERQTSYTSFSADAETFSKQSKPLYVLDSPKVERGVLPTILSWGKK